MWAILKNLTDSIELTNTDTYNNEHLLKGDMSPAEVFFAGILHRIT